VCMPTPKIQNRSFAHSSHYFLALGETDTG
jgi:hypothetical protein